jgi:hypothetical protein
MIKFKIYIFVLEFMTTIKLINMNHNKYSGSCLNNEMKQNELKNVHPRYSLK